MLISLLMVRHRGSPFPAHDCMILAQDVNRLMTAVEDISVDGNSGAELFEYQFVCRQQSVSGTRNGALCTQGREGSPRPPPKMIPEAITGMAIYLVTHFRRVALVRRRQQR